MMQHPSRWVRLKFTLLVAGILILAASCQESDSSQTAEQQIPGFEQIQDRLQSWSRDDYEILEVVNDEGVLRINARLTPVPQDESEIRRRTLNALRDLQAVTGKELHLSVWTYQETSAENLQGMAFYSPVTETYNFKTAAEI